MKNRCLNPNYDEYKDYGGKDICVCQEWMEYEQFREWAINAGYNQTNKRGSQTLDRIDVNGNYCPENCRFVDMYMQANNKQNNVRIEYDGVTHTLSEWAHIIGVPYNYLYYRVRTKGMPLSSFYSVSQH